MFRAITELKKNAAKKDSERKEMADIVEQDKLQEVKGRRPVRLADINPRPQLEGKRVTGDLEIHVNGLRFVSHSRSDNKIGGWM